MSSITNSFLFLIIVLFSGCGALINQKTSLIPDKSPTVFSAEAIEQDRKLREIDLIKARGRELNTNSTILVNQNQSNDAPIRNAIDREDKIYQSTWPTKIEPENKDLDKNDEQINAANEVKIALSGGVYEVPVYINDVLKINFILDSGAADVSIAPDVALTLLRTGTIEAKDWLPGKVYQFADGSTAKSQRFFLKSISIGNRTFRRVPCSIAGSIKAPMLLGQSVLHKLGKYTIDYKRGIFQFD